MKNLFNIYGDYFRENKLFSIFSILVILKIEPVSTLISFILLAVAAYNVFLHLIVISILPMFLTI